MTSSSDSRVYVIWRKPSARRGHFLCSSSWAFVLCFVGVVGICFFVFQDVGWHWFGRCCRLDLGRTREGAAEGVDKNKTQKQTTQTQKHTKHKTTQQKQQQNKHKTTEEAVKEYPWRKQEVKLIMTSCESDDCDTATEPGSPTTIVDFLENANRNFCDPPLPKPAVPPTLMIEASAASSWRDEIEENSVQRKPPQPKKMPVKTAFSSPTRGPRSRSSSPATGSRPTPPAGPPPPWMLKRVTARVAALARPMRDELTTTTTAAAVERRSSGDPDLTRKATDSATAAANLKSGGRPREKVWQGVVGCLLGGPPEADLVGAPVPLAVRRCYDRPRECPSDCHRCIVKVQD